MPKEPKHSPGEVIAAAVIFISGLGAVAGVTYLVTRLVAKSSSLTIPILAGLWVGPTCSRFLLHLTDRIRRGRCLARALRDITAPITGARLRAMKDLRYIGTSAAFYVGAYEERGQGRRLHPVERLAIGFHQNELDDLVLPCLASTAAGPDPSLRRYARDTLMDIGTTQALAILEELETQSTP